MTTSIRRRFLDAFEKMAFQVRNAARGARIYEEMLRDRECTIVLCLARSLVSAGLEHVLVGLVENDMVDVIVSTGAHPVDQDFLEALGFRHYLASPDADDRELLELGKAASEAAS